jgi:SAM-dependent methyltransferase
VSLADLVERHLVAGDPTGWFEPAYAAAGRHLEQLPWVHGSPHPYLCDWLDAPVQRPPGMRALVVGCGLGDDAAELARRGYAVTAVDLAPSALHRARRRFRDLPVDWRHHDVLDAAGRATLQGGFDLVVEVHTVPYLPGVVRDAAMHAIGTFVAPRGVVVVVTLISADDRAPTAEGPPWAQAPSELAAYRSAGLVRLALEHPPEPVDGVLEARITWQRPAGTPPGAGRADGPVLPIVP